LPTRLGERGHGLAETTDVYGFGKENARFLAAMNTKGTILVVDDEESHRYTTRLMLQHAGFQVREATTGQEALQLAEEHPDVIILDLHLPDIAGVEICRILKAAPGTAAIPVLHVTALYPGAEERAEALAAGADGYVTRAAAGHDHNSARPPRRVRPTSGRARRTRVRRAVPSIPDATGAERTRRAGEPCSPA